MKADLAWARTEALGRRRPRARFRSGQADLTSALNTRIAIVLAVIVGQLWGLKMALDAWFGGHTQALWIIVAFQSVSTAITLAVARVPKASRTYR
jgi:hypothetical protein